MHEIFGMQMQMEYGMHFISVSGRYLCYRENFIEGEGQEHCYFSFHHEERFKNTGLHLSCLSVGTELNKIVFGTIRGLIIIYDVFSHQFRVRSPPFRAAKCQTAQWCRCESKATWSTCSPLTKSSSCTTW